MMYRRLAAVAAFVLPSAAFCFDSNLLLTGNGSGLTAQRRPADGFARASWAGDGTTWRMGGSDVSLRVAAGPSPALRSLTSGDVQPVFPMLTMPLGGRHGAQLALIPRSGRTSGAMLAVQIPVF
jgi:hypothetical protein